jgi:hypothetical protein
VVESVLHLRGGPTTVVEGNFVADPTRCGKEAEIVVVAGNSHPLTVYVQRTSPSACLLVEEVLARSYL